MKHLIFFSYIISAVIGLVSIGISFQIYLQYKQKAIKYYSIFLTSLALFIIPSILNFYIKVVPLIDVKLFELISLYLSISGFFLFFIFFPLFIFSLLEIKITGTKKIILILFESSVFILLLIYLITGANLIFLIIRNFLLIGLIVSSLMVIFFYRKKINNSILKKSLIILFILTIIFLPFFIIDNLLNDVFFALPIYYFILSFLNIIFSYKYFTKPSIPEINILPQNFKKTFKISDRENDVILLFIKGFSYNVIGDKLFIAYKTVDKHISNIYKKTNVKNRYQLINLIQKNS